MPEKKELFDYLRNRQKSAEIEAKVNGINIWVLLGAISIIIWKLFDSYGSPVWSQVEFILRAVLISESIYVINGSISAIKDGGGDIAITPKFLSELNLPFLLLCQGLLVTIPPAILAWQFSAGWDSVPLIILGAIYLCLALWVISVQIIDRPKDPQKLPQPYFKTGARASVLTSIVICAPLIVGLVKQWRYFSANITTLDASICKTLSLIAALYLLIMIIIDRRWMNSRTSWTYELETELLLDTVSPDVAARRIESRSLGPRLQDIMDRFFDDMDKRVKNLSDLLDECAPVFEEIRKIPVEYSVEREARYKDATKVYDENLANLTADLKEFAKYIGSRNIRYRLHDSQLVGLQGRCQKYSKQLDALKNKLNAAHGGD